MAACNTATIPPSTFARLRFLRASLPPRLVYKTVGFGGASYISISLSTPIKITDKNTTAMAHDDPRQPVPPQPPVGQVPGRVAKWFPLSASEGFSQWVSDE